MNKIIYRSNNSLPEQILLSLGAVMCMAVFYHIGIYRYWFQERVKRNFDFFLEQRVADLSEDQKKEEAWGPAFVVCKHVARYFDTNNIKDPVVLLEPNEYVRKAAGFKLPEPVIFYYFTQGRVKAIWMQSCEAWKAKYLLRVSKGDITIQRISNRQELAGIVNIYKSYKNEL